MPHTGAYLVSDLPADRLCKIACRKCDRRGAYRPETLPARFRMDAALPDGLVGLSADCPQCGDFASPCGATYLDPIDTTAETLPAKQYPDPFKAQRKGKPRLMG